MSEDFRLKANEHPKSFLNLINTPSNLIAIYTAVRILEEMRNKLGLEAMLEYLKSYRDEVEKESPRLKLAVNDAVKYLNVERLYEKGKRNKS